MSGTITIPARPQVGMVFNGESWVDPSSFLGPPRNPVQGAGTPMGQAAAPGQQPWQSTGLDWNLGTGQLAVGGLTALGNLWNSWQANQLARESFDFQKGMAERNLANSIAAYNTQLADRANSRAAYKGDPSMAEPYIAANRLPGR